MLRTCFVFNYFDPCKLEEEFSVTTAMMNSYIVSPASQTSKNIIKKNIKKPFNGGDGEGDISNFTENHLLTPFHAQGH